jgi:hypothetical protein
MSPRAGGSCTIHTDGSSCTRANLHKDLPGIDHGCHEEENSHRGPLLQDLGAIVVAFLLRMIRAASVLVVDDDGRDVLRCEIRCAPLLKAGTLNISAEGGWA